MCRRRFPYFDRASDGARWRAIADTLAAHGIRAIPDCQRNSVARNSEPTQVDLTRCTDHDGRDKEWADSRLHFTRRELQ